MSKENVIDDWETLTDGGDPATGGEGAPAGTVTADPPETPPETTPPEEEQKVPVSVVQELREEIKGFKADNETLRQNNLALTGQLQNPPVQKPPQEYGGMFDGKEDDDIPNVADLKNIINGMNNTMNNLFTQFGTKLQHNDYNEVVSKHLANALEDDPALVNAINSSNNPYALAIKIAKTAPSYLKEQADKKTTQTNEDAMRKLSENANKSVSINQAAGGTGSPLVDNYQNMSKGDFEDVVAKILAGSNK